MEQAIVVAQSLRAVTSVVSDVLRTYRLSQATRQAELRRLDDKLAEARALTRASAIGVLFRANIEEIAATQRLIDSQELSGEALRYAMAQLGELSVELKRNVEKFINE